MAKSTRGVRPPRRHPNAVLVPSGFQRLRHHGLAPELSRAGRARLAMLDWRRAHGGTVSRTARHVGFSRPTVYRWLARFDRQRLESLEDRPSRPVHRRRPTWTSDQLAAVKAVRERDPRWGTDTLTVLRRRDGRRVSSSMVGRILARLRRSGDLPEPRRRRMRVQGRRWRRPYAIRKPADWALERPGDLVELDTLAIRPLSTLVWEAVHRPRPRQSRGHRRAGPTGHGPGGGRRPRSPGRADALPGAGPQHRGRRRVQGRVRGGLPGPRHPPVGPATALAQAARRRRAGQTGPPPRRSTRSPPPSPSWPPSRPSCAPGRPCPTRSDPTSRSANGPRPNTWPPWASRCNGRTGRVQRLDRATVCDYDCVSNYGRAFS